MIKQYIKNLYYRKIKGMKQHEILIEHLRKTGMKIGDDCWIFSSSIETAEPYLVTIGNHVMISSDVKFTTHDASAAYYLKGTSDIFGRITIGDNVFIGMGTIVLPGVEIAKDCIIGAGSVVTKSFLQPGSIIAGNPVKVISTTEKIRIKNKRYGLNTHNMNFEQKKKYLDDNSEKFKKV